MTVSIDDVFRGIFITGVCVIIASGLTALGLDIWDVDYNIALPIKTGFVGFCLMVVGTIGLCLTDWE